MIDILAYFDELRSGVLHAYDCIRAAWTSPNWRSTDPSTRPPVASKELVPTPLTGKKRGWKWSIAIDANGVPVGWAIDGANRNDVKLLGPTLDDVDRDDLLRDSEAARYYWSSAYAFIWRCCESGVLEQTKMARPEVSAVAAPPDQDRTPRIRACWTGSKD